ncbi:N-acetyl-gamma-glutamyl-phosphate reductase [Candidatus Endolissoclinum faulkneri L5]|uniref:N-acetyl-gamma-glutamyl-phosphate reductase n=1 Tax=Candidatus Endolissoclinum faulkneri L5 TaxID=1401328 RepID=V9TWD9_9PROT|nr:N-acetyl-gamma-glutamyl-phosphate reductase [Candidatus Endolissoclinum faulkneri]AHC73640.1 N-acetyl-gamma-glutamyl-phosphate reductase [Candidatus Endolissoclinum faulkneri L5]
MGVPQIFIDGNTGATGMLIRERLLARNDIGLISLEDQQRKDLKYRIEALYACDIAFLCLPDEAARQAASIAKKSNAKLIDASSAHRTDECWVYGFAEFKEGQREAIMTANRISNPGCYATGAVGILAPLIKAGLLPIDYPFTINAISGYTGGGTSLITRYESEAAENYKPDPFWQYGLNLNHKHVPEITNRLGLVHPPIFQPAVANYAQGMLVNVPLALWQIDRQPTARSLHEILSEHYNNSRFVRVASLTETTKLQELNPQALNGTNLMEIFVLSDDNTRRAVITARLDNLGKGSSGAAVQNMNLLLGIPEDASISMSA